MSTCAARVGSLLILALVAAPHAALAAETTWDFNGNLAASSGPGVLTYRGITGALVQFNTASGFGLPLPPGGDTGVIYIPATNASQGIYLDHASSPNGVHINDGWVSNYTLVFDILWPASSSGQWRSFFNTNLTNANDGDFFADPNNGIGVSGNYRGALQPNTWHRVVCVVGAADNEGQMQKYIDGEFVGGQGTTGSAISSRWALYAQPGPDLILFGDDSGETRPCYVSSVKFFDRRLLQAEAAALGGPTAAGASVAGARWTLPVGTARRVEVIGHRGDSGANPENTLASLDSAWRMGVQTCEIDVRVAADGKVVLMHDSTVDRTTNGTGAASGFTSGQLQALDAGEWFDLAFDGEHAPTLEEALLLSKNRGRLYLDIKVIDGMGPGIAAALAAAGMAAGDIWIWSGYDPGWAANIKSFIPDAKIVWHEVPANWQSGGLAQIKSQYNVVGFDLSTGQVRSMPAGFVDAAHAEGLFVSAYTILDPQVMLEMIDRGVDMMETDFPRTLFSLLTPGGCAGDMTCDGVVNFGDIDRFVEALGYAGGSGWPWAVCPWINGDLNGDATVDFADIDPFVARIGNACGR